MANVSACDLEEARAFINRVVCDDCHADIFNGHAVRGTKTYCMSGCAETARVRDRQALHLCMPVSLAELRAQHGAAAKRLKKTP